MKLICIKEVQYIWAEDIFVFKEGDIIEGDLNLFKQVSLMSLSNWKDSFMSVAEFRENQINSILNDE